MVERLRLDDYLDGGACFHFAQSRLSTRFPERRHKHDFFELFWVHRGRVLHDVAGQVLSLNEGALCFIRPDDEHRLRGARGAASVFNVAVGAETVRHLAGRYGETLAGQAFWSRGPLPSTVSLGRFEQRSLWVWARRMEASGRGQMALDAFLLAVLGLVAFGPYTDAVSSDAPASHAPGWLVDALQVLRFPDGVRRGVPALVEAAGRHPAHVTRVCRAATGHSPADLVTAARMDVAARMLSASDEPIVDVAMDVGLANLSHFYRLFKRHHGLTPRAYRLRHRRDIFGTM